jgi:hypothetical protein
MPWRHDPGYPKQPWEPGNVFLPAFDKKQWIELWCSHITKPADWGVGTYSPPEGELIMIHTPTPVRRKHRRFSWAGVSFLFAAGTCLAGALASAQVAAIIAGILLALGVSAFALHRASLRLDDLIAPESTHSANEHAQPPSAA